MYVLIIFLKRSFLSKYVCSPQYFWRPVCKNISDQLVWNHEWLFLEKYLKWNEIFAWVTWVDMELQTNLPRVTIFPRGPYRALGGKWWPLGGWSAIPYPPASPRQKLPISEGQNYVAKNHVLRKFIAQKKTIIVYFIYNSIQMKSLCNIALIHHFFLGNVSAIIWICEHGGTHLAWSKH